MRRCLMARNDELAITQADVHVDSPIIGGRSGHAGDDPLAPLLGVSNMGGFRYLGSQKDMRMLVITTAGTDTDWPDSLDPETGIFTYFGDNKQPGRALHNTPRRGNEILRNLFSTPMNSYENRIRIPPVLVFQSTGIWRDMKFLGVAVPTIRPQDIDGPLVAVWRTRGTQRFQNYRAKFTILDIPVVPRAWINDIKEGQHFSKNAPSAWSAWVNEGAVHALVAPRTEKFRSKTMQLPADKDSQQLLELVHGHFRARPYDFEKFAADFLHLAIPGISAVEVTRPHRDGGRDAIGKLRVASGASSILIDFAMEAKCFATSHGVGVRHLSRLISRLRHRQFGILVTTSYLDMQAYKELIEDEHPIVVFSGVDIISVLRTNGQRDHRQLKSWLNAEYRTN